MGDRKLDVLIATKVLKYEVFNPWEGAYFMASSIEAIDKARFYDSVSEFVESQPDESVEFCRELPHFDRISGAWQIMERFSRGDMGEEVKEKLFRELDGVFLHRMSSSNAALAVCRAACKVMGVRLPKDEDETGRRVQGQLRELEIGV
jgi:hypothetical protein